MHRFPEHREPWGSALSSSLWSYSSTCSWVCLALSSSGTGRAEGGRLPPSPAVCGTRGRLGSGCWPSSIHSSTADRWRWHRRMGQTSHRSACPGTRHTSGRPAHTVSLPPGPERRQETGLSKASLTRLQSRSCVGSARFFTSLCALPAPWSVGAQPHTELCSHNSWGRTELGEGQTTAQGKGCFRKAYKPEKVGPHQACQGNRRLKGGLGLLLWWKAFQTVPEISWTPGTAGGGQETCWALLIWTGLITLLSASLEAGTEGVLPQLFREHLIDQVKPSYMTWSPFKARENICLFVFLFPRA